MSEYLCDESEIDEDNSPIITEVDGREIAVFCVEDKYYAVLNYCVHQSGPLCEGDIGGKIVVDDDDWTWDFSGNKVVRCPWHGWAFDIDSGKNIADANYSVPTFDTTVKNGGIFIEN
jgi:nitrite reductase/ring-hydroxylating ferredoxin subunit